MHVIPEIQVWKSKVKNKPEKQETIVEPAKRKPCPLQHIDDFPPSSRPPTPPPNLETTGCSCKNDRNCFDCFSKWKKKKKSKRPTFTEITGDTGKNIGGCCKLLGLYFVDVGKLLCCVSNSPKPGYDTRLTELVGQMAKICYGLIKNVFQLLNYVYHCLFVIEEEK